MRTLFYNIFFFIVTVLFITCKYKGDKNDSVLNKIKSSGVDTIYIDLEAIPTNSSFKDFFSKIEIVTLQTTKNSFVEYCQKVIINEQYLNKYVLADAKQLYLVSFDSIGNFIQKSPINIKDSPFEFLHIHIPIFSFGYYFTYDPFDSLYIYFSNTHRKILLYDSKLNYINKTTINLGEDPSFDTFIPLNKDLYAFSRISNCSFEEWGEDICFYSKSGDSIFKNLRLIQEIMSFRTWDSPFSSFKNRFFYQSQIISNAVYEIHPDSLSITPYIVVNYGNKSITEDNKYKFYVDRDKSSNGIINSNRFAYLLNMLQNNKSYWFFSCFNGTIYVSVFDKETKAMHTVIAGSFVSTIPLLTDEILYCVIDTFQTQELIDSGILTKENAENLEKIKAGNNPVILKCYLK